MYFVLLLFAVRIMVSGILSNPKNLLSYGFPQIYRVQGCKQNSLKSTSNCPRTGGIRITIHGRNFGAVAGEVRIGSSWWCNEVAPDEETPHNKLTCLLPPGRNAQEVYVYQATRGVSRKTGKLQYDPCLPGYYVCPQLPLLIYTHIHTHTHTYTHTIRKEGGSGVEAPNTKCTVHINNQYI